jgi:hypothetical protein
MFGNDGDLNLRNKETLKDEMDTFSDGSTITPPGYA